MIDGDNNIIIIVFLVVSAIDKTFYFQNIKVIYRKLSTITLNIIIFCYHKSSVIQLLCLRVSVCEMCRIYDNPTTIP